MAGGWRRLGERVFGPSVEPGGPGAGTHLWWQLPPGQARVVSASVVLEVMQPPQLGRRYAWGLQATVLDASGRQLSIVAAALAHEAAGGWRTEISGRREQSLEEADVAAPSGPFRMAIATGGQGAVEADLLVRPHGVALTDVAVWMELVLPPDDPPVVARWSSLLGRLADGTAAAVPSVLVTFPTGPDWRRLDAQADDVGVLQISNTRRRTANRTVLALPPAR